MANKDFGYVWEGEAQGVSLISNISFDGASSVNDVDAVAYGFDAEGNATKDTTAISAGKLTYSSTTGTFSCECPFTDCVSWKLFIWRRNVALSVSDVSWSSGQTIPVSAIVTELNLLRQRVEDMTTNVGRGVRVPEQGNNETTILPPLESRSGQVSGYDASGRPAVGKDVPEVAALYSARDEAVTAAEGAKASELSAGQFANEAGIHSSDASESLAGAVSAANEAATYATRASTSASTAKNEADRAEAAKENIEEYEQKSAASATASASSASEAATYAGQAKSYQSIASSNANAAGQYASNASTSASSAASFANVAGDKASAASSSAKAAAQSETNAANSANAAALSARESEAAADSAAFEAVAAASASANAAAIAQEASVSATAAAESAEQAAQSAEALANVYTKPQIDGVSTGAEVTLKMNEIIAQLKDWEEVTGETLPNEFWEALMAEFQRWQENPTETKEWVPVEGTESYFTETPTKPVIDFSVTYAGTKSFLSVPVFTTDTGVFVYLPEATSIQYAAVRNTAGITIIAPNSTRNYETFSNGTVGTKVLYYPKVVNGEAMLQRTKSNPKVILPKATSITFLAQNSTVFNNEVIAPNVTAWGSAFLGASKYNQFTDMRSAKSAGVAFRSTSMSKENIAATLDTLPTWEDGASHVISFSRYDGTLLAPLMAESPYVESVNTAVAKGWTVQFD